MRLMVYSMRDVVLFSILFLLSTFGLPYLSMLIFAITPTFAFFGITITGYGGWFLLWHFVWIFVDAAFNHVTIKFVYDSIIFIKDKIKK